MNGNLDKCSLNPSFDLLHALSEIIICIAVKFRFLRSFLGSNVSKLEVTPEVEVVTQTASVERSFKNRHYSWTMRRRETNTKIKLLLAHANTQKNSKCYQGMVTFASLWQSKCHFKSEWCIWWFQKKSFYCRTFALVSLLSNRKRFVNYIEDCFAPNRTDEHDFNVIISSKQTPHEEHNSYVLNYCDKPAFHIHT